MLWTKLPLPFIGCLSSRPNVRRLEAALGAFLGFLIVVIVRNELARKQLTPDGAIQFGKALAIRDAARMQDNRVAELGLLTGSVRRVEAHYVVWATVVRSNQTIHNVALELTERGKEAPETVSER